jgi:hypothetical protein
MSVTHRTDLVRSLPELLGAPRAQRGPTNPFVMVVPAQPVAPHERGC